jgi:hypothetical protein
MYTYKLYNFKLMYIFPINVLGEAYEEFINLNGFIPYMKAGAECAKSNKC